MLVILAGLLAVACGCVAADIPLTLDIEEAFERFIHEHERDYTTHREKLSRFEIFKKNVQEAIHKNEESNNTVFGITQFMDLTSAEFITTYGCLKHEKLSTSFCNVLTDNDIPTVDAPESFDWRDQGVVTRVKNQDKCGSCWAFSTIGNLEGMYAKKNKELVEFSEQQLVDCDNSSVTHGCEGGDMSDALSYLIDAGGAMTAADYAYVGKQTSCQFDVSKVKAKVSECNQYQLTSQEKLKQLVFQNGPVTIGLDASTLNTYRTNILLASDCPGTDINHGLVLVGYGIDNGTKYWIIKNSWGETFGHDGYLKLERGEGTNACGIMNDSSTATAVLK